MAPKEINTDEIADAIAKIALKIEQLEAGMNARFDKLKEAVIDYISLGNDMVRGSVIATLKNI